MTIPFFKLLAFVNWKRTSSNWRHPILNSFGEARLPFRTNFCSGTKIGPKWEPGFTKAIQYWVPSIATSALSIYKGKEFEEWNGHALITSLKDKSLRKLIFNDLSDVKEEIIFNDKIGRIRDIQVHPNNGKIYFLAENNFWLMEKN